MFPLSDNTGGLECVLRLRLQLKKRHTVELVIDALTIRKFTDNTKF